MPRYVDPDGRSCVVELQGRTVVVDGHVQTHVNPATARDAHLAFVEALTDRGFALDAEPDPEDERREVLVRATRHPELERAIDDAPDDPAAYAVFGDFLQTGNDPWGTLIALQLAGKMENATTFIEDHVDGLMGDLAVAWRYHDVEIEWRWGFFRRVKVNVTVGASYTHAELTRDVLQHRFARNLESLELFHGASSVTVLRKAAQANRLRELVVRGEHKPLDLSWLPSAMPQLERLEVRNAQVVVALDHPRLRHVRLWEGTWSEVSSARAASCPHLSIVELAADEHVSRRLATLATCAPALRELGIAIESDVEAPAALLTLIASPLAARVRRLSLRFTAKPTVAAFGDHLAYLRGLEAVRLAGTRPLVRSRDAIQAALPNVKFN